MDGVAAASLAVTAAAQFAHTTSLALVLSTTAPSTPTIPASPTASSAAPAHAPFTAGVPLPDNIAAAAAAAAVTAAMGLGGMGTVLLGGPGAGHASLAAAANVPTPARSGGWNSGHALPATGGRWSGREDARLREVVQAHGPKMWKMISQVRGKEREGKREGKERDTGGEDTCIPMPLVRVVYDMCVVWCFACCVVCECLPSSSCS